MKLKVKLLKLSAGRPVAILNKEFAEKSSINVDDRIFIQKSNRRIAAVVDIAADFLKKNEIALSSEVINHLQLKKNSEVLIEQAIRPKSLEYIHKKLSCKKLKKSEILEIIKDIVNNTITESEIAYFVSGVYKCGMSMEETVDLTEAIVKTGKKLPIKGKVVDKHSIGGIPGRTTPIIIAICSSLGLLMPKTSSRAITTPAGTADAMETICKVDFSMQEIKHILKKANAMLVWGGSLNLAPADDKIIQVERLLNIDPEPQLLASILAKKIAANSKYVLIDIPYGKYAKVNYEKAKDLEKKFIELGKHFKMKIECFLEEVKEPTGNGIGPALEIKEVIEVLKRESSGYKIEEKSLKISGKILEMTGKCKKGKGYETAKRVLDSGKAFEKFKQIVELQRGKIIEIREAKFKKTIRADKNCKISEINIKSLNEMARYLGCPIDKYSGIYLHKHLNQKIKKSEPILTLYSETQAELHEAEKYLKEAKPLKFS